VSFLHLVRHPPLREVRLDTGSKNVLGVEAIRALANAMAPDPEAPVVVLSGHDRAFCAGLDMAALAESALAREDLLTAMAELLLNVVTSPTRVVAVCEGHAVAAGAMLLLVADVRIGAPGTYKIGFTEPRLGMPLPELPALLARERLDRRRLHALTALGHTVNPEEAVHAGFLDRLVEPGTLDTTASAHARHLAELSDAAYQGTVRSVWGTAIERMRVLVDAQIARRDAARSA